jgi:murein DD-endopeptidase MepM/ murein hydrolase activator NlpD
MGAARATHRRRLPATHLLLVSAMALAACNNPLGSGGGSGVEATAPTVANLAPDSRGVITYATYQVAVARDGDTLADVAARVGTTTEALATRNALPPDYRLRAGEVLLLPADVARPLETGAGGLAGGTVTSQPLGGPGSTATTAAGADNPFQNGQTEPLIDPVRHRVEAGETAYSIARLYGVSVTALASWNGLGPDLAVRENQELLIPIVGDANRISTGIDEDTRPGQGTPVPAPPSASAPLPADITAAVEPESPNLGATRTPAGGRLSPPLSGKITRPYDGKNGVGFDAPAGTAVKAAAPGEVALVSEALGGLGSIVLVRHKDDLMTTYSTLTDVKVRQGDRVQTGQVLGDVADREHDELQFDVFRGTTSVDPTPYLGMQ